MEDIDVLNELSELWDNLVHYRNFDFSINKLRFLYKKYPEYFSEDTIKKINYYKEKYLIICKEKAERIRRNQESNPNYGKTCNDAKYVISRDGTVSRVR